MVCIVRDKRHLDDEGVIIPSRTDLFISVLGKSCFATYCFMLLVFIKNIAKTTCFSVDRHEC